ncbi:cytochrome c-type biogenesis protein [Salsuginibacillus halophilus]|uniref:Cytochrome c-type biogenesis protein n=1 Tax=Salsuginibacillus halophilus TaxID=517424 RepID=A0A2P8HBE8_9BACI|nr:cytochrome c biogenesis protein CcdA [Salsuginibacillus halophilus]PSL43547.1 cytochrome c-type biogenesis protein [Salsuginibacillus halophilus]
MTEVTILLAFGAGLLAFISPCTLPLYPSFISYITGASVNELKTNRGLWPITLKHSILFCLGFSLVYYVLGFSASAVGSMFTDYQMLIQQLGGIFLVLVGLFLTGILQPSLLMSEKRMTSFMPKKTSAFSTFVIGIIFGAGWTPCIGPIFGTIMYHSAAYPDQAFVNITSYALGFSLPFIAMGFALGKVSVITKYSSLFMKIGGAFIIAIGIMVFFDWIIYINIWSQQLQNMLLN